MEINGVAVSSLVHTQEVSCAVCAREGHNIALFESLGRYFICTKCGMNLDEIRCTPPSINRLANQAA
jgi:hypothetical protein